MLQRWKGRTSLGCGKASLECRGCITLRLLACPSMPPSLLQSVKLPPLLCTLVTVKGKWVELSQPLHQQRSIQGDSRPQWADCMGTGFLPGLALVKAACGEQLSPHPDLTLLFVTRRLCGSLPAPQRLRWRAEARAGAGARRARLPGRGVRRVQRPREPTVQPVGSLLPRGGGRDRQLLHGRLLHL